ncbi:hypothetical protein SteCoe_19835 [Stentor coeruleus]|uniref:Uncharacterized protein n=1 Tax=Stentor coeruleus TaxID=5963 RepID=A0A1R2BT71_9CILI|nr:hypothetical protein SteCoe_19835 [Stentor coeruleus]
MDYRKSQWTESISSLLRKTEMNLIRIQTPYREEVPRVYTPMPYNGSFYENPTIQEPPRPPTDYKDDTLPIIQQEITTVKSSLERLLNERLKGQKKDLDDINERLATLEINSQDINQFKENIQASLYSIEKKCLSEVKRIENSGKGFISQEDLRSATESIRTANMNSIKQLEKEVDQIRSGDMNVKEEVYRITEEKVRDISKKFVSNFEFNSLKDTVLKQTQENFRELEFNLNEKLDDFRTENNREVLTFEQKVLDLSKKFDQKEENIYKKIRDLETSLEKSTKKSAEERKKIEQEFEKISNTEDIDDLTARVKRLESQMQNIPMEFPEPDLSHLVQKKELILLNTKLQELEAYKKSVNEKILKLEKKIDEVEERIFESSDEIDDELVAKQDENINKSSATFGKSENTEGTSALTKIFINDLGDSDSESHGYTSPHISPMNQLPISALKFDEKKDDQKFDFKHKTNLRINQGLGMINEDPAVENKIKEEDKYKNKKPAEEEKNSEPEGKKVEVKRFPVESVKVDTKKPSEDSFKNLKNKDLEGSGKIKDLPGQNKKGNKKLISSESESSESEDMFGLKNVRKVEIQKPIISTQKASNAISLDVESVFKSPKQPEIMKKPVEVEVVKKPVEIEVMKKPVEIEVVKKPVEIEVMKKPVEVEIMKKPVEVEVMKKPIEVVKKPVEVEVVKKPVEVEVVKKPVEVEVIKKPVEVEVSKKPVEVEIAKKPVEVEVAKKPVIKKPMEFEVDLDLDLDLDFGGPKKVETSKKIFESKPTQEKLQEKPQEPAKVLNKPTDLAPIGGKMSKAQPELAPIGGKMAKNPEIKPKGPEINNQLASFISSFTEDFITEHIELGCACVQAKPKKNLLKIGKNEFSNLNKPQNIKNMMMYDTPESSSNGNYSRSESNDSFGLDVDLP